MSNIDESLWKYQAIKSEEKATDLLEAIEDFLALVDSGAAPMDNLIILRDAVLRFHKQNAKLRGI